MSLPRNVLHEISFQIAQRLEELEVVVQQTLFGIQNSNSKELLREMLEYLTKHNLVSVDEVRLFRSTISEAIRISKMFFEII